jgi:hypothetical protein
MNDPIFRVLTPAPGVISKTCVLFCSPNCCQIVATASVDDDEDMRGVLILTSLEEEPSRVNRSDSPSKNGDW